MDEIFNTEPSVEAGKWDGNRLEWLSGGQVIKAQTVPPSDQLLALIHSAARTFGCLAIAGHESDAIGHQVIDDETWYSKVPVPVTFTTTKTFPDGRTTVEVEVVATASKWMWILVPLVALSFAWVFFLVVGGLRELGRQFWKMAVTGTTQSLRVTLGQDTITVDHSETGEPDTTESTEAKGLLAFSYGLAAVGTPRLLAIYSDRVVPLPSLVKRKNDREQVAQMALVAQLNMAIGSY